MEDVSRFPREEEMEGRSGGASVGSSTPETGGHDAPGPRCAGTSGSGRTDPAGGRM